MSKELFVSSTPHETKVAMVEEDQLAEIYFERENEYTLAGSIYKGRVTRVLPGMQSAFVDIGLERDAFLYVSDFFEQAEEDDEGIENLPAERGQRGENKRSEAASDSSGPETAETQAEEEPAQAHSQPAAVSNPQPAEEQPGGTAQPVGAREPREPRERFNRRRRGRRGRGFPDSKFDRRPQAPPRDLADRVEAVRSSYQPIILPGESISKYRNLNPNVSTAAADQNSETTLAPGGANELGAAEPSHSEHEAQRFVSGAAENVEAAEEAPVRRPTEEIDVQSILHGEGEMQAEQGSEDSGKAQVAPGARSAGVLEEEEIEEEEAETPQLAAQDEEDGDYEDFEEEMLDRLDDLERRESGAAGLESFGMRPPATGEIVAGAETFSQTKAQHTASDAEAAPEQYSEPAENGAELGPGELAEEEFGEQELAEESSEISNTAPPQPETSQAQLRGPSGYQQRVAFERGPRGRRGGRRGHVRGRSFHRGPMPQISDLLKEGQEVLVQIAKEPIGKKGARITSHIALPGRFLVYMPTINHNGVSRKIASEEERQRLKRIIQSERQESGAHSGGFIVRTAATSASDDDLRADIRFLLNLWNEINQRAEASKPPALIYHDLNLVERVLRDQVSEGFSHIWVDTEQEYERVLRFVNRFQPSLTKRVKLYTKEVPLFEQFNIQEEINKSLKSKVWLKSGGYIVINQTEALVAIDVNTGKYVGKTQKLEDTIVKTNVDAIKEIVRQIRLRDLGGIIVIDFIDMDERRNRQKVMQALDEALKNDRAPSKVLQFNDFGLVAITRKRVRQSLERTLGSPCTYCSGTGLIKSVATVCNEMYVEMRKMARHLENQDVIVRVNPEVAKALKTNNARWLQDMEDLTGKTVLVKSDPTLHQEQFDIH